MTISLETAFIARAQAALSMATTTAGADAKRTAFIKMAFGILSCASLEEQGDRLKALAEKNTLIEKAVSHDLNSPEWNGGAGALAASFVASIAELSLLDSIAKYARPLPNAGGSHALIASGAVGNVALEGDPIPVQNLSLSLAGIEPTTSAALVILSEELVRIGGDAVLALFETELANAAGRAANDSVLNLLIDSNTAVVDSTGDALMDLRAGLAAAGPSDAYVVAAPAGAVTDLATRAENRGGMGVRGGSFIPGIEIVGIDDASGWTVIPASRLALWDGGLRVRSAEHASVNMQASPSAPSELVSLWQSGLRGLAVDRRWHLSGDTSGVVIIRESTS